MILSWHSQNLFSEDPTSPEKTGEPPAAKTSPEADASVAAKNAWEISIPVRYLPLQRVEKDADGKKKTVVETGESLLTLPAKEVALVLVDTWGHPGESEKPSPIRAKQKAILEKCREHGVTIVHAPNHPVVDKYPQYLALKKTVDDFMKDYSTQLQNPPPFLEWPPSDNKVWLKAQAIRWKTQAAAYAAEPQSKRDISRHLKPRDDDYVLCAYNEFRYVLWKERTKLLLYVGGALNECMLQRDTGINLLAGTDSTRVPVTIVVLEDCSSVIASPGADKETAAKVMLDFYRYKMAFTSGSTGRYPPNRPGQLHGPTGNRGSLAALSPARVCLQSARRISRSR